MYTFKKNMRLCSQRAIQELFEKGDGFLVYPFSVHYLVTPDKENAGLKVLIVAPKRYQHHSVCRNRAKRLMREAFRLHKNSLAAFALENGVGIDLSISLVSKTLPDFPLTEKKIIRILSSLEQKIKEFSTQSK